MDRAELEHVAAAAMTALRQLRELLGGELPPPVSDADALDTLSVDELAEFAQDWLDEVDREWERRRRVLDEALERKTGRAASGHVFKGR